MKWIELEEDFSLYIISLDTQFHLLVNDTLVSIIISPLDNSPYNGECTIFTEVSDAKSVS